MPPAPSSKPPVTPMNSNKAKRPPLYLLPGLICDARVWRDQVDGLDWPEVVAINAYAGARTMRAMAEIVLAAAPERFALAGHSMGGRVALEVFRLAPERVDRLALLDTGVHPVQPGEREKRMALVEIGRQQGMAALVDRWLPPMVHPARRSDDAFMRPLREMCIEAGLETFEQQVAALLDRPDAGPLLDAIACPALVATGRQDEWSPVAQHEEIAARIPGSTLVVFEDTGHMSTVESPGKVTAALQDWLEA
jgi:pimeloyl-ACP methyl ester carboxylesterase